MLFLDFVLVVGLVLALVFFGTQFVVPLCTGKPTFPRWRKAGRHVQDLRQELSELELEAEAFRLESEARERRAELDRLRQARDGTSASSASEPQSPNGAGTAPTK